jgi:hypothetical protein
VPTHLLITNSYTAPARRSVERGNRLGFATSLCTSPHALIHGARTCTQLHSHAGRTLVPPSAASGRETGLEGCEQVRVSTPSALPTRLQLGHCLPSGMITLGL